MLGRDLTSREKRYLALAEIALGPLDTQAPGETQLPHLYRHKKMA